MILYLLSKLLNSLETSSCVNYSVCKHWKVIIFVFNLLRLLNWLLWFSPHRVLLLCRAWAIVCAMDFDSHLWHGFSFGAVLGSKVWSRCDVDRLFEGLRIAVLVCVIKIRCKSCVECVSAGICLHVKFNFWLVFFLFVDCRQVGCVWWRDLPACSLILLIVRFFCELEVLYMQLAALFAVAEECQFYVGGVSQLFDSRIKVADTLAIY